MLEHRFFVQPNLQQDRLLRRAMCTFAVALVTVAYIAWALYAGGTRTALGYETETDFIGGFVPEARRFLDGEPLLSTYHPPLYAIMLGWTYRIVGDWTAAGFLIAQISGVLSIAASYVLFGRLFGALYGLGAAIGLLLVPTFLSYSVQATSDAPFTAALLLAAATTVAAVRSGSFRAAAAGGALIGCAALMRTNGLLACILILTAFAAPADFHKQLKLLAATMAGLLVPVTLMIAYAVATDSSLMPSGTVDNLAMTYFAEGDRITAESMQQVKGRFGSLFDVIAHDPVRVATIYARDLVRGLLWLPSMIAGPLAFAVIPGLIVLVLKSDRLAAVVFVAFAAQVALTALKAFEARFFLFLVPVMGAAVVQSAMLTLGVLASRWKWRAAAAVLAGACILGVGLAMINAKRKLSVISEEVASLIAAGVPQSIQRDAVIVARKPHLAFYAGSEPQPIPQVDDLGALKDAITSIAAPGPVYLFFGKEEVRTRPALSRALRDGPTPPWLEPVARSAPPNEWTLFKVDFPRV